MAQAKHKARVTLFYYPVDEILQTQWDIGIAAGATGDIVDIGRDAMAGGLTAYLQAVATAFVPCLSADARVIGFQLNHVDDVQQGRQTLRYEIAGTGPGNALPNDCFVKLDWYGETYYTPGSLMPRLRTSSQHISGFPVGFQSDGFITPTGRLAFDAFQTAIKNLPNNFGSGDPLVVCMSGKDYDIRVDEEVRPLINRRQERVANRPQGRPSRP